MIRLSLTFSTIQERLSVKFIMVENQRIFFVQKSRHHCHYPVMKKSKSISFIAFIRQVFEIMN